MNKDFSYEENLRGLEVAKYQYESLIALLNYKSDRMLELNKLRAISSIEILVNELTDLKEILTK